MSGRPKGGTNRYWSKEEKLRIVKRWLNGEGSQRQIAEQEMIMCSVLKVWLHRYLAEGEAGLENKQKPGNPLVRFQRKKKLTELERLEYENMKLRIENLRLKKGYTEEEVKAIRQKQSSKRNTKSSKN
ncbi:MAG: helix-turn-helix domain-containing protein [Bacillus subtilis]|nr:helix-turn-helix domain-containing protein [Bacillus subtilis]MCK7487861.1 helix-turn-helix domain-containing protein [Bacillus subtilis]